MKISQQQWFWPEIEADGEGLSKPHRQHKLTEEREEEEEYFICGLLFAIFVTIFVVKVL